MDFWTTLTQYSYVHLVSILLTITSRGKNKKLILHVKNTDLAAPHRGGQVARVTQCSAGSPECLDFAPLSLVYS